MSDQEFLAEYEANFQRMMAQVCEFGGMFFVDEDVDGHDD